jgi:hypothetical protein
MASTKQFPTDLQPINPMPLEEHTPKDQQGHDETADYGANHMHRSMVPPASKVQPK